MLSAPLTRAGVPADLYGTKKPGTRKAGDGKKTKIKPKKKPVKKPYGY